MMSPFSTAQATLPVPAAAGQQRVMPLPMVSPIILGVRLGWEGPLGPQRAAARAKQARVTAAEATVARPARVALMAQVQRPDPVGRLAPVETRVPALSAQLPHLRLAMVPIWS